MEKKFLTYEEFGAIGDGIADDMAAIVACHDYANENKLPVKATGGASYYIGARDLSAKIKTDTDFSTAKFIIDDRELENIKAPIFLVLPDAQSFKPEIKSMVKGQKKVDFPHTGNVFVKVFSDDHKIYIRKGLNQNSGSNPSDCFMVDKDGNVLNDINWDHKSVCDTYAISADDAPITISGGVFITIANRAPSKYTYHKRNFQITRSNLTVKDLTHYIIGELDHGAPYEGFISVADCANFTAENLLLTPHFTYMTESQIPGKLVSMGTYDLSFTAAINATLKGIRQTIDITDRRYWGLMGSNYSKEIHLDGCVMSRFDAHCGVTNATIKNCTLGHQGLNLIGFGEFVIENSTVKGASFINFRPDYGSFFDGNVTIKDCTWEPCCGNGAQIFSAYNTGDHDFGYRCTLPKNITIDGLTVKDSAFKSSTKLYILPNYDSDFSLDKPFAYGTTAVISLVGISVESGRGLKLFENSMQYLAE